MSEVEYPRIAVRLSEDGVHLIFIDPCPWCGERHYHGAGDGPPVAYGHRTTHCANHTHAVTASGRRAVLRDHNICKEDHWGYLLVPEGSER